MADDPILVGVLEERLDGLRDWLDERFRRLDDQFTQQAESRELQREAYETLRKKVFDDHEDRLVKLERLAWMTIVITSFLSPVVVWAIIEIIKQVR
jgi:hypothetical protein